MHALIVSNTPESTQALFHAASQMLLADTEMAKVFRLYYYSANHVDEVMKQVIATKITTNTGLSSGSRRVNHVFFVPSLVTPLSIDGFPIMPVRRDYFNCVFTVADAGVTDNTAARYIFTVVKMSLGDTGAQNYAPSLNELWKFHIDPYMRYMYSLSVRE